MDAFDEILEAVDESSVGQRFQHFDLGGGAQDARVTRADLETFTLRILRAIAGETTSVMGEKPVNDTQPDDDAEERAKWRSQALRWKRNG